MSDVVIPNDHRSNLRTSLSGFFLGWGGGKRWGMGRGRISMAGGGTGYGSTRHKYKVPRYRGMFLVGGKGKGKVRQSA